VEFSVTTVLSIIALLIGLSIGVWMKILSNRAFKSIDGEIKAMSTRAEKLEITCSELDGVQRNVEIELVRLDEFKKAVDVQMNQLRADFVRENQIVVSQLKSIHSKIEYIDQKFDKLRGWNPRSGRDDDPE
jgi:hypothetical protein